MLVPLNWLPLFTAQCTYSTTPPFIQLRPEAAAKDPMVTIKFDHASRSWKDRDYLKLHFFLKKHKVKLLKTNEWVWIVRFAFLTWQTFNYLEGTGCGKCASRTRSVWILQRATEWKNIKSCKRRGKIYPLPSNKVSVWPAQARGQKVLNGWVLGQPHEERGSNHYTRKFNLQNWLVCRPRLMDQTAGPSNLRRSARTVAPPPITPAPDQDEV